MVEKDLATKDERDLFSKIEPIEEDVAEENPPQDGERSCHQNRTF